MKIIGRGAARRSTCRQVRAGPKILSAAKNQSRQLTGLRPTEGKHRGQRAEKSAARPGDPGCSEAKPEAIPAQGLDQQQAQAVLAALEDAAVLRREAIGNCPDCRSAIERVCTDHQGSWETAEEYDSLRWHLDSAWRGGQADHEAEAAAHAPTEYPKPKETGVHGAEGGRNGQAAGVLQPGQIGQGGEPEPEEHVPPAVPDTGRGVPPEVYNAIADYAREVNRRSAARAESRT